MHAKTSSILMLGHTQESRKYLHAGIGEIANATKLHATMRQAGYNVEAIVDIFDLFGGIKELYEPLALLNYDLAEMGHPIIEESSLQGALEVREKILGAQSDFIFILSWCWSVAALYATGIQKSVPTIAKLYAHHDTEMVMTPLYEPSALLITESILASDRGIHYGLPPWKIVHLPHHYPEHIDQITPDESYIERVALENGKKVSFNKNTFVVGAVSRLIYGKNIEFALSVMKKLAQEGHDFVFLLKGDLEKNTSYLVYNEWLLERLESLKNEQWFLWDRKPSPFPSILKEFAVFDIFMHLSGAEAGSNVIVELMALGIPALILEGSTNNSLFNGGALFVKNTGEMREALVPFRLPDERDLEQKLRELLHDKTLREEIGRRGKEVATLRFHPSLTVERLPLILQAAQSYTKGDEKCDRLKKQIESLYKKDCERYGA